MTIANQWQGIAQANKKIQETKNQVLNPKLLKAVYENTKPQSMVFDYGCGWGEFANLLAQEKHQVYAFDKSNQMITNAKEKFSKPKFIYAQDFENYFPLYKKSFDLVVSNLVLCILEESEQDLMLSRIKKLIKKEGAIIISLCHPCFDYEENSMVSQRIVEPGVKYDQTFKYRKQVHENHLEFSDYHRPLAYYTQLFKHHGLRIENIMESDLLGTNHKPDFIIFVLKKAL